ncbi:MAG: hypothetical protein SF052_09285 [Bacteroidia bacterium]|nr:hypothetical protein [Bacteroidia bacterium]
MKPISVPSLLSFCLSLLFFGGMQISDVTARPDGQIQYPSLQLINKNEQPTQASYRFKKANGMLNLQLKLQNGEVLVRMLKGQDQVIAQGKIVKSGKNRIVTITMTQNSLLAYWHFALDRVILSGKSLSLKSLDADYPTTLLECIQACYQIKLKDFIKADNIGKLVDKANQGSETGNAGGCGDISICTSTTLSEYDQCVQDCYEQYDE